MTRAAVIDIGTNTFHALAVEFRASGEWDVLYKERIFVNLAEQGINFIADRPWNAGLDAIQHFMGRLDALDIQAVKVLGTAALRTASNGWDFIDTVTRKFGVTIEVISGETEAQYIASGVMHAVEYNRSPLLLLDIGGGSIELIICEAGKVCFVRSYPLGIAILHERYHHNEPIGLAAIELMEREHEAALSELLDQAANYPHISLVGPAGSFEVLEAHLTPVAGGNAHGIYLKSDFYPLYKNIVLADYAERCKMEGIPLSRARYIVVAFALIRFFLDRIDSPQFYISNYALKEVVLLSLREGKV